MIKLEKKADGSVYHCGQQLIDQHGDPSAECCGSYTWDELLAARQLWERVEMPDGWIDTSCGTYLQKGTVNVVSKETDPRELHALADYLDAVRAREAL